MSNTLRWITAVLSSLLDASDSDEERSLYDGSEMIGDMNHRTNRMDCGQDAGGFYEDDL
jgi:hypothetical protein